MTAFATLQAAYAAHRIATYPLKENKTPAVRAYDRIGASYSAQLAMRFPDATAAGFVAGPRNRVTVVDIDSADIASRRSTTITLSARSRAPGTTKQPAATGSAARHARQPTEKRSLPSVATLLLRCC
jgi:hypothetical protein